MNTTQTTQPYADGAGPERAARRPDSPANPATPPAYPEETSSTEIRRDISRTRTEMDSTLDQLGERLNPSNLIDDAAGFAKSWLGFGSSSASARTTAEPVYEERVMEDGTVVKIRHEGTVAQGSPDPFGIGDVYHSGTRLLSTVGDAIRDNPVATAICGAGLAYAFFEDPLKKAARQQYRRWSFSHDAPPMHSGSYVDARTGLPYDESTYGAGYRNPNERSWTEAAGDALSSAAGYVTGSASAAGDAAAEAAGSAKRAAANTSRDVTVKAGRVTDTATGALLHAGTEAKDGVYNAADTAADAAGNVTDKATGALLYAGSAAAESARSAGRSVKATAGSVYDSTTGALLHAGSEVKDGTYAAADTVADAAGNVYHATTGAFLYAGSAVANAARSPPATRSPWRPATPTTRRPAPCCTRASRSKTAPTPPPTTSPTRPATCTTPRPGRCCRPVPRSPTRFVRLPRPSRTSRRTPTTRPAPTANTPWRKLWTATKRPATGSSAACMRTRWPSASGSSPPDC